MPIHSNVHLDNSIWHCSLAQRPRQTSAVAAARVGEAAMRPFEELFWTLILILTYFARAPSSRKAENQCHDD